MHEVQRERERERGKGGAMLVKWPCCFLVPSSLAQWQCARASLAASVVQVRAATQRAWADLRRQGKGVTAPYVPVAMLI